MAVVRIRKHHASDETAERKRHSEVRGDPRHPEAEQHDREQKHLRAAKIDHTAEKFRQQKPRSEHDKHQRQDRTAEAHRDGCQTYLAAAPQKRDDQQHEYDTDVLKKQDADGGLSVRGVDLFSIDVGLEHYRRTRKSDEETEKYRLSGRPTQSNGKSRDRRDRQYHLESPAHQYEPFHFGQPLDRKFEADGEQKQHYADLGKDLDIFKSSDEPEPVRTDRHTCQHEPHKQRQS